MAPPFVFVILKVGGLAPFSFLPDFIAKTQNPFVADPHLDEFIHGLVLG